jgi:hypothetical protein
MTTTEPEFTEAEIFEALQFIFRDWRGRPFSFENVRDISDETMAMTRDQFNRFVFELNDTRCGVCGTNEGVPLCDNCFDDSRRAQEADEFDRARKGE